jgi:hypothetical protein
MKYIRRAPKVSPEKGDERAQPSRSFDNEKYVSELVITAMGIQARISFMPREGRKFLLLYLGERLRRTTILRAA